MELVTLPPYDDTDIAVFHTALVLQILMCSIGREREDHRRMVVMCHFEREERTSMTRRPFFSSILLSNDLFLITEREDYRRENIVGWIRRAYVEKKGSTFFTIIIIMMIIIIIMIIITHACRGS